MRAPTIYHGTPITPNPAFELVMPGRAACVSYYRPDQLDLVQQHCPWRMYDNGRFSDWQEALREGREWDERDYDPTPFYTWLEPLVFQPGCWGVIPDTPGAPSQINDGLLNTNPFGTSRMAPLWHMDQPIYRLGKLCERYDRVCLGWVGHPKLEPVGCDAYRQVMDDVGRFFGNRWPVTHMMRGVAVARDYPFRLRRRHDARAERPSLRLQAERGARGALRRAIGLRRQAGRKAA